MKKIVFVITKSEIGGAQTWVRDQIKLLNKDFESIIITNESGWLTNNVTESKVFFVKEIESRFSIKALLKILKILKQEKVDISVSSSANAGLYSRLTRVFYKHRVIYVSHGWSCLYNGGRLQPVLIKIENFLSFFSDKILCVSKKDKEKAVDIIGIKGSKIEVIRNAIYPKKQRVKEIDSTFNILFLGRLATPKRLDLLIEAVNKIEDVTLTIVGDGPKTGTYRLNSKVKFLGAISNFNEFYKYDLFALISDSEGLPMSALEAASAGMPLLLSNVGGCSELINNNGLIVDNNVKDIVDAINNIKNNYLIYNKSAHSNMLDFDINKLKGDYIKLYSGE